MPWPWPPLHRVFRAFDDLPEGVAVRECSRMLRPNRPAMLLDACSFGLCAAVAISMGSCLVGMFAMSMLAGRDEVRAAFVAVVGGSVIVAVCTYLAAAWRYQRLAADVLSQRLGPANDHVWNLCAKCKYPLSDLPVEGGRVICPECGESHPLIDGY